jgi:hypothetical protein
MTDPMICKNLVSPWWRPWKAPTPLCAPYCVGTHRAWGHNRVTSGITVDDACLDVMGGKGFKAAWVERGELTRNRAGLDAWEDWHAIAA